MTASQENKILEMAVQGDKASLEYLVSLYKDLAYTIAIKILLNREDAEEVVQDAFLKAFASLGSFKKAARFSTWLYRIVYNTAITKSRSKGIITSSLDNIKDEPHLNGMAVEWEILRQKERKKYIDIALKKLTVEDHLIVTLHYIAGKDIATICEITGMKRSAVKMRLLRARKQLQVELEQLLGNEIKDFYE
ncbi:sigma-70 family RNA polymerase sigma factor [Chitinophaga agrisoli]|uniref:RNA polymerase sigma factor n=1 Tax=Chitinophaga agrisoli TaxID=2607653 RepID=A0A5B2W118_9BACT|nr:sigma-70 family RNA polymerase sigma factor [Chitinophaga agrisoli]KAA2244440.1 sigma-70 family RNA polymerase sigma factor [Chitinophaga agrisoli]